MRIIALLGALGSLVLAAPAHAATTRTFTATKGSFTVGRNWVPEGKPQLGDPLTIPAGHTAELSGVGKSGPLDVEGELTGAGQLEATGDVTLRPGIGWHGTLKAVGLVHLASGGNLIGYVGIRGDLILTEALHAGAMEWTGLFSSEGHELTVDGLAYPLEESSSSYEGSMVRVGEWIVYPFELFEDKWTFQFSETASFEVGAGKCESRFKAGGWYYGTVKLVATCSVASGDSWSSDSYVIDTPLVTYEPGHTVTTESLSFGPGEHVLRSTGGGTTIECGCEVPSGVTLEDVTVR